MRLKPSEAPRPGSVTWIKNNTVALISLSMKTAMFALYISQYMKIN